MFNVLVPISKKKTVKALLELERDDFDLIGTLRYEDGRARAGTVVDARNFRGFCRVAKNKMLKMCIFAKDGDVKNSNFEKRYSQTRFTLEEIFPDS